jgi:hypothetical protein
MATYGGSSDVSYGYTLRSGSTHVSTKSLPVETSSLEGYADAPIYRFTGIPDLRKRVHSQSAAIQARRTTKQYLVFRGVTKDHLARIDRQHASIGKHTRKTHYADTDLLIIKLMPSEENQSAFLSLASEVNHKLEGMGSPRRSLCPLGGTTFFTPNSSKEGDSVFKPKCRPRAGDWPTIVFGAGYSESLTSLRADAQWWLTNTGGEVKIAIVISIASAEKSLRIEQWCSSLSPRLRPATRAHPNANTPVPVKIQELTVTQDPPLPGAIPTYTVTGAPLTLEFEKLLLRAPVPPEGNVILTAADLREWGEDLWSAFM